MGCASSIPEDDVESEFDGPLHRFENPKKYTATVLVGEKIKRFPLFADCDRSFQHLDCTETDSSNLLRHAFENFKMV